MSKEKSANILLISFISLMVAMVFVLKMMGY